MEEIVEMSDLDLDLQVTAVEIGESKGRKKLVDLMREEMDGTDQRENGWKIFKQRLGLTKMSCCGATWSLRANSNMDVRDEVEEEEQQRLTTETTNAAEAEAEAEIPVEELDPPPPSSTPDVIPAGGMNLAAALAAEREFRATQELEGGGVEPTPTTVGRVSLIKLMEESNGVDEEREKEEKGNELMCCVCMGRRKGAAFIPCGHTFCRVCSREIWVNRGTCPLCNRSIVEILDIF